MREDILEIAVIDIGSNTVRLQVSEVQDKSYRIVDEYKDLTMLGNYIFDKGMLEQDGLEKLLHVMRDIKTIIDTRGAKLMRAVATASLRAASNHEEVLKAIKDTTGIEVEIISGEEEARLTYLAATGNFQLSKYKALIVDIGGGSAEFTLVDKGEMIKSASHEIGCSKLTRKFLESDPVKESEYRDLKDYIIEDIESFGLDNTLDVLICAGGSLNNISSIFYAKKPTDASQVKYVERKYLKKIISDLKFKSVEERKAIDGLEEKRAANILPAPVIVDTIMAQCEIGGFYTLSGGLRNGMTIDALNRLGIELPFQNNYDDVRFSRLLEIGNKYKFDEEHALHVRKLTMRLFELLKDELFLNDDDCDLLEASALLHDIGNYISYSKHHKHAYYLIKNSELIGFSNTEIEIIANVARYHRKSPPKQKHEPFQNADEESQERILKLASIIRIADALDRSQRSQVIDFDIKITDDSINISLYADGNISMEIRGFGLKKQLLEDITGKQVTLV